MCKPASREITSAAVELCETEVCFLHIQLIGSNVRLPKMHTIPLMLTWRLQSLLQSQNLETIQICIVVLCSHTTTLPVLTCVMKEIKRAKRLSQDVVHFVTARASLFTDLKISSLPIRAKYRHFARV